MLEIVDPSIPNQAIARVPDGVLPMQNPLGRIELKQSGLFGDPYMAQLDEHWGADLRLLSNLDQQNDRDRANDLSIVEKEMQSGGEVAMVLPVDLALLEGADNLKQALLLRFMTPLGELAGLGHSDYGCRLYELIGELNSETNRNRAKMFVLQALAAEPRVKEVRSVVVTQGRVERTQIDIQVSLVPIHSDTVLNFVFPFFFERGFST